MSKFSVSKSHSFKSLRFDSQKMPPKNTPATKKQKLSIFDSFIKKLEKTKVISEQEREALRNVMARGITVRFSGIVKNLNNEWKSMLVEPQVDQWEFKVAGSDEVLSGELLDLLKLGVKGSMTTGVTDQGSFRIKFKSTAGKLAIDMYALEGGVLTEGDEPEVHAQVKAYAGFGDKYGWYFDLCGLSKKSTHDTSATTGQIRALEHPFDI